MKRTQVASQDQGDTFAPGGGETSAVEVLGFNRCRSGRPVERIVIYRLGSIGDTIVALPCLHKIAEVFPDAERYVLTNAPVSSKAAPLASVLMNSGLIHGVADYPVRLRSAGQILALARKLRRLGTSTLVYLTVPRGRLAVYRDAIFFRLCGFKRLIGLPHTSDLATRKPDPLTGLVEQEYKRLARTLASLGPIDLDDPANWDLRLTDEEHEAGARILAPLGDRPFVAINMGGKIQVKIWGDDNWRRLLRELAKSHGGYGLLAVGVDEEAAAVELVTRGWPAPVINACGRLSPRESAAALRKARLFVGHDSGPMHLAATVGVPCVALFGAGNLPGAWYPYGPGHKVIHRVEGIAGIGVGEVLESIREALPALTTEQALP